MSQGEMYPLAQSAKYVSLWQDLVTGWRQSASDSLPYLCDLSPYSPVRVSGSTGSALFDIDHSKEHHLVHNLKATQGRNALISGLVTFIVAIGLSVVGASPADADVQDGKSRQFMNRSTSPVTPGGDCLQYVTDTHLQYVTKVPCLPGPVLPSAQLWNYDAASGQLSVSLQEGAGSKMLCLDSLSVFSGVGVNVENVPVQVLPCVIGDLEDQYLKVKAQQWDYVPASGAFRNRANGYCLGSVLNIALPTLPLVTLECNDEPSQGWDSLGANKLAGQLWIDADGDGEREEGDGALEGVTIHLLDKHGKPLVPAISTTTGSGKLGVGTGSFKFSRLEAGAYRIKVDLPAGYHATVSNAAGVDEGDDSDISAEGVSDVLRLSEPTLLDLNLLLESQAITAGVTQH